MKKASLMNVIRMAGSAVIVAAGLLLVLLDIGGSYHDFLARSEQMRARLETEQKNVVKQEVVQAVRFIQERLGNAETEAKGSVLARTGEGHAIAENIYRKNKGKKSDAEIQAMILDALRPTRFFKGTGYYFITRLDGVEILFADRPQLEGKNLLSLRDPDGREVIRDMIAIASQKGEGFYRYRWTKPGRAENSFDKIAYIKRFEPYGWLIGCGLYLEDVQEQIKENLFDRLSRVRYGREGYLFINRHNGDALVTNGKILSGKNKLWDEFPEHREGLKTIFQQEMDAAKKPDGDFIRYSFRQLNSEKVSTKVSFVKGLSDPGWIIGAGFYADEIDESIRAMTADLKVEMWKRIGRNTVIVALAIIIFLIVVGLIEKKLSDRLKTFLQFFAKAAHSDELFDRSHLHFEELDQIAEHVNRMLVDKRDAKNALVQEKENLSVTLHSIGDAVISTDRAGNVAVMNEVAEKLTGWDADEAAGKSLNDVFHIVNAQTGEGVENPVDRVLRENRIVGLANHTKLISRDGGEYQIADSAAPICDQGGNITGVVLVFRDVTEQYHKDEQLRRSEEDLRAIFNVARQFAFIKTGVDNPAGEILQYSPGAEEIFGYSSEEMIGNTVSVLHLPRDAEKFPGMIAEMGRNKVGFNGEITLVRKSGEHFPAFLTTYPLFDAKGDISGVIGITIDLSRQKEAEEKIRTLEKLQSIGVLAGGLAHDFNNIMMGLFGNISLARMRLEADSPALPFMEKAEKSLERATSLTNQLLTFAKGGVPVTEEVCLADLIEQTVQFDLSGSNVKPVFEREPGLWKANADRGQMHQVFSNLTINAKQAMPEGGTLAVRIGNCVVDGQGAVPLPAGRYLNISFADQGAGIEKQNLDKIFDPYFTTKKEGRGLGLATTYSIVSRHGGHIGIDSEVGKGTTVTLYLPAYEGEEKTMVSAAGDCQDRGGGAAGRFRVMLMDDEEMVRDVVGEMLEVSGYDVKSVADGVEALELYREALDCGCRFDCVIMDLTIPGGMGGREAVKKLLEMDPDAIAIVSSGYAEDPIMAGYGEYGFKGVIAKPFKIDELREKLARLFDTLPGFREN